ncbi:MAG: hypothetical protein J5I47_03170 [Vicingus serpentipes]|nr:hypothetical protein [Vicingus serpentipes]
MTDNEKLEFYNHATEKVYFYIESKFWSKLTNNQFQKWLNNFKSIDEKYCAAKLLDRFVYYSEEDIIQLLKYGVHELLIRINHINVEVKNDFNTQETVLSTLKNNFIENTAFIPLNSGNPTESGNVIASYLCKEHGIPEGNVLDAMKLTSDVISKYQNIIIVDDFIGSGDQIINFWSYDDVILDGNQIKMYEIANKHQEIKFKYFCLVTTEEGYNNFYSEGLHHDKRLDIVYCEKLKPKFKIFGEKSVYFDNSEKDNYKNIIDNICKVNGINLLGHKGLDYAVAFHHNIPDASLPLFYEQKESWNYLFRSKLTKELTNV